MKKNLLIVFFALFAFGLFAEDRVENTTVVNMQTLKKTSVEAARFEILASKQFAFKLDKYNGEVYQLVSTGLFSPGKWVLMSRQVENMNDSVCANAVNYQLYIHEEQASHVFLMNVNTGATWTLGKRGENRAYSWEAILKE